MGRVKALRQLLLGRFRRNRHEAGEKGPQVQVQGPASSRDLVPTAHHAEVIAQATACAQAGDLARSLSLLGEQLVHDPDSAELHYARALTLSDWGRLRESLESLRAAESRGLSSFGLHLNTAQLCHLLGFGEEAEQRARQATRLDPTSARAHLCLATALQSAGRQEEAAQSYAHAFELAPERVDCLRFIANCKLEQKDATGAEAVIRRAISVAGGDQAKSWTILGIALSRQDRCSEALQAFDRAEEIEARTGHGSEIFLDHGFALFSFGQVNEALEVYERQLPLQPHLAQTHYGYALLAAGRFREGWEQYEFRRFIEPLLLSRPSLGLPMWNGQDLRGKTLLVWAEQGIGDTIQFARFGRLLKSRGATVILRVHEKLKQIALDLVGFDRVIVKPDEVDTRFDYYVPTLSLPRVLCPDVASIPADVPYLQIDPARLQRWREVLAGAQVKVGLLWAGNPLHDNDRRRSIDLAKLAPLWDIEGVQYFSLQKEQRAGDSRHFTARLIDLAPQLDDFRDTAAAIEALDLVISVDTAAAHIAGALAKPVWVLLPAGADFRWLRDRDDSPWYPTMRLFRQRQLGQWDEVISRVEQALRNAVREQGAGRLSDALLTPAKRSTASEASAQREAERPAVVVSGLSRVAETRYGIMQYMPDRDDVALSIEQYGEWLQPQLDLLDGFLRPGATVLEAPSGIGAHVLPLSRMIGTAGHLLAYEKDPLLNRILVQNIRANRLGGMVTVMLREVVGRKTEAGGDLTPATANNVSAMAGPAQTETIDELLLDRLELIKLNECRHVREILEGAAETLWRLRPMLLLSVADTGTLVELGDHAKSFGYRCWQMETGLFNKDNFNRRDTDIFSDRKGIALVAIPEESGIDITAGQCVELPYL